VPDYLCAHKSIERGEPPCQRIPGSDLDRAIGTLLMGRVTPEALALTIAIQDELVARADEAQRKRAMRFLLEDVTVHKSNQIVAHIRFKGGATQTITVSLPPPFAQSRLTAPETLAAMDRLLEEYTDAEVAEQLNQRGYRTFDGLLFQGIHVYQLRRHHKIPDRYARLRAQGMLTAEELARNLGVSAQVIWRRYHQGRIGGVRYNDRGSCLFSPPQENQQPLAESN